MPTLQHEQGVLSRLGRDAGLQGYNPANALALDLGAANNDATVLCTSLQDFSQQFPAAVTVGDQTITLGPDVLPLPGALARQVRKNPAGLYQRVCRQKQLIQNSSPDQIPRLYQELRDLVSEYRNAQP